MADEQHGAAAGATHSGDDRALVREICHDMRQPLATMTALVRAARLAADDPETLLLRLDKIEAQLGHLEELCHRLAAPGAGDAPAGALVALDAVAAEVSGAVAEAYAGTVVADLDPATVHGDAVALRRVLWNLVTNACRAAGEPGTVVVRTRCAGGEVVVTVDDSGPGFGAGPAGTAGLGLPIVTRLVTSMGGGMSAGGRGELGGARVELWFPACGDPDAGAAPAGVLTR